MASASVLTRVGIIQQYAAEALLFLGDFTSPAAGTKLTKLKEQGFAQLCRSSSEASPQTNKMYFGGDCSERIIREVGSG